MKVYRDFLFGSIWMALLVALMLFPAVTAGPLPLNSRAGVTTPVSADGGASWSGDWIIVENMDGGATKMTLTQSGNKVTGYSWAAGRKVDCIIDSNNPNIASGNWDATNRMVSEMTLSPDGQSITVVTGFSDSTRRWTYHYTRLGSGTTTSTGTNTTAGAGWSGTWTYASSWGDITITQSGNKLTGVWANTGYGTLTGTISGNKFTGTNRVAFDTSSPLSNWELTLAPDGQSITGTMKVPDSAFSGSNVILTRTGTGTGPTTATNTTNNTNAGAALVAESRMADPNTTVQVPIRFNNASNIGSMNFVLTYDPQVLKVNRVDTGSLLSGALFTPN
jgi:hypothetical protein